MSTRPRHNPLSARQIESSGGKNTVDTDSFTAIVQRTEIESGENPKGFSEGELHADSNPSTVAASKTAASNSNNKPARVRCLKGIAIGAGKIPTLGPLGPSWLVGVIACSQQLTKFPVQSAMMGIRDVSWLDLVGLAIAVTLLEVAIRGVGATVGKGRRSHWRVAPRFRPILGLAGLGLLVLVTAHFLTRFNLLPHR